MSETLINVTSYMFLVVRVKEHLENIRTNLMKWGIVNVFCVFYVETLNYKHMLLVLLRLTRKERSFSITVISGVLTDENYYKLPCPVISYISHSRKNVQHLKRQVT